MKENLEMSISEMFQMLEMDLPNPKVQRDIVDMFVKNLFAVPFGMMLDKLKVKREKIIEINKQLEKVSPTNCERSYRRV